MIKLIFACVAACVFSGCTATPMKEPPVTYNPDATVSLLPQTSTVIRPGVTLRFERVDDSRCPPDVVCITAGKIVYSFTLTGSAIAEPEPFTLEPAAPTYKSVQVPDLVIALTSEPPPRQPSTSPSAPPQAVVLTISP